MSYRMETGGKICWGRMRWEQNRRIYLRSPFGLTAANTGQATPLLLLLPYTHMYRSSKLQPTYLIVGRVWRPHSSLPDQALPSWQIPATPAGTPRTHEEEGEVLAALGTWQCTPG